MITSLLWICFYVPGTVLCASQLRDLLNVLIDLSFQQSMRKVPLLLPLGSGGLERQCVCLRSHS